jgi:hypothetical protein
MPFRELVGTYRIGSAATHVSPAGSLVVDTKSGNVYVENGLTAGTLIGSNVSRVIFNLTSAQLMASGTPIQILAPPGANKIYMIESVTYILKFGTIAYSGDGSGTGLWYGTSISVDTGDNAVFTGVASQFQQSLPYSSVEYSPFPMSICGNCAINFWAPNSPLSGGDGTGVISFIYQIVSY